MNSRLRRALELLTEARELVNSEIGESDGETLRRAENSIMLAAEAVEQACDEKGEASAC